MYFFINRNDMADNDGVTVVILQNPCLHLKFYNYISKRFTGFSSENTDTVSNSAITCFGFPVNWLIIQDFTTTTHRHLSNGTIAVALRIGLPFVPGYLGQTGSIEYIIQGVNYASASAGIIFSSGSELGQHISLTQKIQQFTDTYQQLNMGKEAAVDFISNSVFYILIGINDYMHYYLPNVSSVQNLYLPWGFNHFLGINVRLQIKNLYNTNVRKVVLMGLPPIGCALYYLWKYNIENGECVRKMNDIIMEFNYVMRYMVKELLEELSDAYIIFCDISEGSVDVIKNHEHYGLNVRSDACCGVGKFEGGDNVPITRNSLQQCFKSHLVGSVPSN